MTEQDKQLLLKLFSETLPYGLKVKVYDSDLIHTVVGIDLEKGLLRVVSKNIYSHVLFEHCMPYLRPMSSMTEEEKKTLNNILEYQYCSDDSCMCESTDWLNAYHFDYRNLIDKDIALVALEGTYETKN